MMKKITSVLAALLTCLIVAAPLYIVNAGAESDLPRLVDYSDLLTTDEEENLLYRLDEISEDYQCDVVIVTVDSLDGKTATEYADDFFDYNNYGFGSNYDGILLLVSIEERDWAISTTGYGIEVFTDAGLSYMSDEFVPYLSSGEYAESFNTFVNLCEDFLIQAENGEPYDVNNKPFKMLEFVYIPASIIVGFIIAAIIVNIMRASLISVSKKASATDYLRKGSLKITNQRDNYLYHNVSKTRRETSTTSSSRGGSSTHRSSSGRSHGGSSGKF